MTKSEQGVNFSEFARQVGVSQPMVSRYVKLGQISERSLVKTGKRVMIIPKLAIEDLEKNLDPGQRKKPKLPDYKFWDIENVDETFKRIDRAVNELGFVAYCLTDGTLKYHLEAGLQEIVDVFNGKFG